MADSKSAVGMAFDPVAFKKTKHILRAAEFLRDLVNRGVISVEHLPGVVMLAVRPAHEGCLAGHLHWTDEAA